MLGAQLRDLIDEFDRQEEIRRIDGVDWNLELGAITEMLALRDGPSLLFDHIKGYPEGFRVLSNLTNNPRRVGMLFGLPKTAGGIEIVRTIRERFTEMNLTDPVEVRSSGFDEESRSGSQVNMLDFPSPFWHEHDGGRYIGTACVVVTRDLEDKWVNLGTYRVQVHDERTLGLYLEPPHHGNLMMQRFWERGESAPIAICIGVQPALLMSAFLAIPWGVSEYKFAGGLLGRPVETVRGEITGLPLPASAEIVIEGFCPPPSQETRLEGPFGETIGYYASTPDQRPVIHVEAVYYRRNPILVGSPPLRPPASSSASYLFRAANLWNQMERAGVPDIRGVWMIPSGASSALAVVSIEQRYGGHVKQVGMAAMTGTAGAGLVGRYVIVVDHDIDPSDVEQVLWAVAMRSDPEESIEIIRQATGAYLDPRIPPEKRAAGDFTMSRAIIDACRPYRWRDQFPRPVGTSSELQAQVLRDWPQLFD
ncbi:MAG TPA: UbiD family decarboxylase [Chloroflexota bacterium]